MEGINIIERAFQLAPECGSVDEVKRKLVREGYLQVEAHLSGRQIRTDLNERLNPSLKDEVPNRPHTRLHRTRRT